MYILSSIRKAFVETIDRQNWVEFIVTIFLHLTHIPSWPHCNTFPEKRICFMLVYWNDFNSKSEISWNKREFSERASEKKDFSLRICFQLLIKFNQTKFYITDSFVVFKIHWHGWKTEETSICPHFTSGGDRRK